MLIKFVPSTAREPGKQIWNEFEMSHTVDTAREFHAVGADIWFLVLGPDFLWNPFAFARGVFPFAGQEGDRGGGSLGTAGLEQSARPQRAEGIPGRPDGQALPLS